MKAATACISLIQSYPDKQEIVDQVTPIVTEEWGHFRQVLKELSDRGLSLGHQRKDEYVKALLKFQKKGGSPEDHLLERLLICALIEARSCERFRLLSLEMKDEYFKKFYHSFMVSEAGHYRMFIDLAKTYIDEDKVKIRWQEYLDAEIEILKAIGLRGDRMH